MCSQGCVQTQSAVWQSTRLEGQNLSICSDFCKYAKDKAGQELEQDSAADSTHALVIRSRYGYKPVSFKDSED